MKERKGLSKTTRFEVFKRDLFTCQYCGQHPPAIILEVDHVIAVANGGSNDQDNLITACVDCNRGKAAHPLDQVTPPIKEKMAQARERAEQLEEYNEFLLDARNKELEIVEEIGWYWFNKYKEEKDAWVFGDGRIPSIRNFVRRLTKTEILEAIDIAFARFPVYGDNDYKTFKYFCGVCWRTFERRNQNG